MYQSVLVTGASSGIGEATAIHLAHKGFRVFAAARRTDRLRALSGMAAGRITPLAMDVCDAASIAAAFEQIRAQGVALYGLVNNAGVSVMGPVETTSDEDLRAQFETNFFGLAAVTRAALPAMRAAKRGRIINIGSVNGRIAAPFHGAYAASKHAVEGLTDSLRLEMAPHGVKVSLIRPGFIHTDFGVREQDALEGQPVDNPYADQMRVFKAWHARGHTTAASPNLIAEAVHHALTADRPHARYTAPQSMMGALLMRNLFPTWLSDRLFERITGLDMFRKKNQSS